MQFASIGEICVEKKEGGKTLQLCKDYCAVLHREKKQQNDFSVYENNSIIMYCCSKENKIHVDTLFLNVLLHTAIKMETKAKED